MGEIVTKAEDIQAGETSLTGSPLDHLVHPVRGQRGLALLAQPKPGSGLGRRGAG